MQILNAGVKFLNAGVEVSNAGVSMKILNAGHFEDFERLWCDPAPGSLQNPGCAGGA
jgi:hypothetical protein